MNFPDFYKIIDKLPDEDIRSASVMMKAAWCHFEQQRLFAKFKEQYPDLTSVVIVSYGVFPTFEVVATFRDGSRRSEKYESGLFQGDAETTLSHILALYDIKMD
jgi:hypothetical protein